MKRDDNASVAGLPIGHARTREEIALAIAFLFAGQAGYISESLIAVDGAIPLGPYSA